MTFIMRQTVLRLVSYALLISCFSAYYTFHISSEALSGKEGRLQSSRTDRHEEPGVVCAIPNQNSESLNLLTKQSSYARRATYKFASNITWSNDTSSGAASISEFVSSSILSIVPAASPTAEKISIANGTTFGATEAVPGSVSDYPVTSSQSLEVSSFNPLSSTPYGNGTLESVSLVVTLTQTLPATFTLDGTTLVTIIVVTTLTTLHKSSTTLSRVASASHVSSATTGSSVSDTPAISFTSPSTVSTIDSYHTISASSTPAVLGSCDNDIPAWCVYPTTVPIDTNGGLSNSRVSTSFCACPTCLMGSHLCSMSPPMQTTSCPDGWLCHLTIPYPTSTAWYLVPSGLAWQATSDDHAWSAYPETLTHHSDSEITGVTWSAALSTSTQSRSDGSIVLFPLRIWVCLGNLCDPDLGLHGLHWLDNVICLIKALCPPFEGIDGWSPPLPPIQPPIGPPALDYQLEPSTVAGDNEPTGSDSSTASSSQSSTSCSASPVTSCTEICSTVSHATTLSETCSQSCTTVTICSGTNTYTTSTAPCTETMTSRTILCSTTTVLGQTATLCTNSTTVTTGCQDTTTFAACSLNQGPIGSSVQQILASLAARYTFNPADITVTFPASGSISSSVSTSSEPNLLKPGPKMVPSPSPRSSPSNLAPQQTQQSCSDGDFKCVSNLPSSATSSPDQTLSAPPAQETQAPCDTNEDKCTASSSNSRAGFGLSIGGLSLF